MIFRAVGVVEQIVEVFYFHHQSDFRYSIYRRCDGLLFALKNDGIIKERETLT